MRSLEYLNCDIAIAQVNDSFTARILNSPAGEAKTEFRNPFTSLETENFLLRMGRAPTVTRRVDSPEIEILKSYGGRLFRELFGGDLLPCFQRSIEIAEAESKGLRIRLRLTDAPTLSDLPWEYIYHPAVNKFLALSSETPLVRYLDLPGTPSSLLTRFPLKILVAIASPAEYPTLDVEKEWLLMKGSVGSLENRGLIQLERLNAVSVDSLRRSLRSSEYHVLHFIGHGTFRDGAQDGALLFEDSDKGPQLVSGEDLGVLLNDHRSLRLVILNSCEGGRPSLTDPYAGVAQSVIQQGIPAVIAMQFAITDDAALSFSREFYQLLCEGYAVDTAVSLTRQSMFLNLKSTEWGTPVLYLRATSGKIIEVDPNAILSPDAASVTKTTEEAESAVADKELLTRIQFLEEELRRHPANVDAYVVLNACRQRRRALDAYAAGRKKIREGRTWEPTEELAVLKELAPESMEFKNLKDACDVAYAQPSLIARVFLMYRPVTAWLWLCHLVWYLVLLISVPMIVALITGRGDPDYGSMVGGFIFFWFIGLAANLVANAVDVKRMTRRRRRSGRN